MGAHTRVQGWPCPHPPQISALGALGAGGVGAAAHLLSGGHPATPLSPCPQISFWGTGVLPALKPSRGGSLGRPPSPQHLGATGTPSPGHPQPCPRPPRDPGPPCARGAVEGIAPRPLLSALLGQLLLTPGAKLARIGSDL